MTFELEVMKTKNTAFSVEILGNQCAPMQYVRELTQNSIEAIKEKGERGQILWTFDRQIENLTGTRKLCIMDNGAGMDGEDIRNLMNRMFSSGKQQGLTENYGIGAKVAGLHRSPLGMIYQVWKEGNGYVGQLMKNPDKNEYGLYQYPEEDGSLSPYQELEDGLMPQKKRCTITDSGTQVTLLGKYEDEDTYLPEDAPYGRNWLPRYLNSRYFKLPEYVDLAVSCNLHKHEDGTPKYQIRVIKGMLEFNNKYSEWSGIVNIRGARVHWWVLEELDNERPEFPSVSHTASLYQDELYDYEEKNKTNLTRLHRFGIIQLVKRVVIYVEPTGENVTTDPSRTFLSIGAAKKIPWDDWGDQFTEKMPDELRRLEEEASEKATDADLDKAAADMLKSWMKSFEVPKFLITSESDLEVSEPEDYGGQPESGTEDGTRSGQEGTGTTDSGSKGNIFSDFIRKKGKPGKETKTDNSIPKVEWVTPETQPLLEDRAAQYIRQQNRLLINGDFRGFTSIVNSVLAEKGGNKPGAKSTIEEIAKLHYQVSICETIIRVQRLKMGGKTWKQEEIDGALSEVSLTAAVMSHKLLHDRISTSVGHKLGAVKKKAASDN
jgi:hypothetical protein